MFEDTNTWEYRCVFTLYEITSSYSPNSAMQDSHTEKRITERYALPPSAFDPRALILELPSIGTLASSSLQYKSDRCTPDRRPRLAPRTRTVEPRT